jgi:Subtilase family
LGDDLLSGGKVSDENKMAASASAREEGAAPAEYMKPDKTWRAQGLDHAVADQVGYIVSHFRRKNIDIGVVTVKHKPGEKPAAGVSFMYAKGQLIVRDGYVDRVKKILESRFPVRPTESQRFVGGILLLLIPAEGSGKGDRKDADGNEHLVNGNGDTRQGNELPRRSGEDRDAGPGGNEQPLSEDDKCAECGERRHREGETPCVLTILKVLDKELGPGIATPNHLLTVAGEMGPCPATEPQGVYDDIEPFPSVCPGNGGAGVLIYIADTGLLADAASTHSWLAGVKGADDPLPPIPDGETVQRIPPYTGHGTFVAGVVRCMAPGADIYVDNAFAVAGSALETDFVQKLTDALGRGVDIFHLAVTAPTRNDLPLVSFEGWMGLLDQYKGVVCVVAAGNNGNRLPCWPAAFPGMVSVGALAADWHSLANFSNYGGWVDVYAPGRGLINAYATGTYTCHVAPYEGQDRKFYGTARWSGTSFSTPIVTGLIAARMSRYGESGQQAADALLAKARAQAVPGVGAVLLPCCDDDERRGRCGCRCEGACGCGCCGCRCGKGPERREPGPR